MAQTAAERRRTHDSLTQIDDLPMFRMDWRGEVAAVESDTPAATSPTAERSPFGCTLFVAFGGDRPLVGRNFDWDPNPAVVVCSQVRGGPRSVSASDLSFVGFPGGRLDVLRDPEQRDGLERAHAGVVDGMNEWGLFIGLSR